MGQASQQRCICLAGGGGMTHPRKVRKKCQRVHLDCKICIFNYVNSLFFSFFWIIYPFLLLFCHFQSFIFVIFLLQLSPDIFLKGLRKRFKKMMPSSVSSFPGNRFFVFSLQLVINELAAPQTFRKRGRRGERERKVWRDARAYLYTGNLLHKTFAHYHIVMERHAYMSTATLCSLCPPESPALFSQVGSYSHCFG